MRSSKGRGFVLAVVSALALAACNPDADESGDDATADATPAATETTDEATATDGSSVGETTGPTTEDAGAGGGEGEQILAAAIGAIGDDVTARTRVTSTSSTPQGDVEVVAEGVQSGSNSRMTMTATGMAGAPDDATLEMILVDGAIYQKSDLLDSQLGTDDKWVLFDSAMGSGFEAMLDTAQNADPADTLEVFRNAGSVEVVGQEEVNGVQTTHLVVTIPLRASLEAQGMDESAMQGTGVDLDQPVEYDLWIDGDDLMRRMTIDVDVEGVTTSTTVDVLEYGMDVDIEAPPADQVVSFQELMQQSGGGTG